MHAPEAESLEEVIEKDLGLALFVALDVLLHPSGEIGKLLLTCFVHVIPVWSSEFGCYAEA